MYIELEVSPKFSRLNEEIEIIVTILEKDKIHSNNFEAKNLMLEAKVKSY